MLISTDSPFQAQAVLVLAGDYSGNRIIKAAQLVNQGLAPVVFVSGPGMIYGVDEAHLAINFAVAHGYPPAMFVAMQSNALSTSDEAIYFAQELERRGIRRLMIVTSDFHTRRAGRIFRKGLAPGTDIHMIAAPDPYFHADRWWTVREARKTFFYEWSKTIAAWVGM
jgi:uncharacterized SAM-binding protein YcdF (DUF218 family)